MMVFQAENNMSIEDLMAKYKSVAAKSSKMEVDIDSDDDCKCAFALYWEIRL